MSFEQRLLERAAASTVYPATPQLRSRVLAQISGPEERHFALGRRLVVAAGAAAVLVLAVVLGVPGSRTAIADFLHIRGSKIERLPTPRPGEVPTPFPTPVGIQFDARPVTMDDAARVVGFPPLLPAGRGEPQPYVILYGDVPIAVMHYENFDLWETRAGGFFGKSVRADSIIHQLQVKGRDATWVLGGNHIVQYLNEAGTPVAGSQRTVDRNTMIWSDGTTFFRLETDLPEAEAISILESLP